MPKPYIVQDAFFHKAKEQGFRARSAFKLLEIQEKMKLIAPGDHVLDLGAAPGSWLQVAQQYVTEDGYVLGVDTQQIDTIGGVKTVVADVFADDIVSLIQNIHPERFDVVLSDLAPKTTGIKDTDQYHSVELNEQVVTLCDALLKEGGALVTKVFVGADFQRYLKHMKERFTKVKNIKPKATRDRSFEVYVVGTGFRKA